MRDGSALHIQTMYRGFRVRKAHGKVPARAARTRSTSSQQGSKAAASDAGAKRSDRAGSVDSVIDREAFDDRRGAAGQATSAVESIPALKADKSSLKKQLKQFDIDFKAKHGRMVRGAGCGCVGCEWVGDLIHDNWPLTLVASSCVCLQPTNDDKEPIRHLYRRYAELKDAIAELEAEVRRLGVPVTAAPLCADLPVACDLCCARPRGPREGVVPGAPSRATSALR